MKTIFIFFILISNVFAISPVSRELQEDLKFLILEKEDILTSDGEITKMVCTEMPDRIACDVEFTFYDERSVEVCTELYTYFGADYYDILESDCWFRELNN